MSRLRRVPSPHMRDKYASGAPLVSGETVAPGDFRCCECGYELRLDAGVANLPVCPRCQGERWELR